MSTGSSTHPQITTSTPHPLSPLSSSMDSWIVIAIIAACIVLLALTALVSYVVIKRIQKRRKVHGEYRPQQEENLHAKNLPYITPPSIEGMI